MYCGSAKAVWEADENALRQFGLKEKQVSAIADGQRKIEALKMYDELTKREIRFTLRWEDDFPQRLKELPDGPDWLFVSGKMPMDDVPSVAIIGARECSNYGKIVAEEFAEVLADAGIQIISGMARGIDGYAQKAAVRKGQSFAVLGCGVDTCYPRENYELFCKLQTCGGILSEYVPGTKGLAYHFPMRNRIISGLADALVVVEARKKSGTLITVECALDQGKDVFAVPGRIGESLSEGCNELLRQGAHIAVNCADILEVLLENYPEYREKQKKQGTQKALSQAEQTVLLYLQAEPRHVEELLRATNMRMPELMQVLYLLEHKGIAVSPMNGFYARARL